VVVQDTALNGAQVASLLQVLGMAATGTLPKESATQVIKAAFPGVPDALVAGMINPIEVRESAPPPEPAQPKPPKAEFAEPGAKKAPDGVDALADRTEAAAAEAMERLMEPVRRLVAGAGSLEEIREGILECYPDMDTESMSGVLADAFTVAFHMGADSVGNR
jgi:hypothetical protein